LNYARAMLILPHLRDYFVVESFASSYSFAKPDGKFGYSLVKGNLSSISRRHRRGAMPHLRSEYRGFRRFLPVNPL